MKIPDEKIPGSRKTLTIFVSLLIFISLISLPFQQNTVRGETSYTFISEPGKIPKLSDWETPVIEPGDKGKMKFSITNRYFERGFSSNNITNVVLFLGVYQYATLEDKEVVDNSFPNSPEISRLISSKSSDAATYEKVTGIITNEPETNIKLLRLSWSTIPVNTTYTLELEIKTFSSTPEGTYFVKTELRFNHAGIENQSFVMKSKGHYSEAKWNLAKNTAPEDFLPGLNLSVLEVNGILPDTSFSVKIPMPFWPFYILAGLTIFFAVLAVVFYYMEEQGKFPRLKEKLEGKK